MSLIGEASKIFKGSKGITDAGSDVARVTKTTSTDLTKKNLATNLAKYSLIPAAAGIGTGVGIYAAGTGLSNGIEEVKKTTSITGSVTESGITGWILLAIVAFGAFYVIKSFLGGGKK